MTNSNKKFDPWIKKSEEKVKEGMKKAASLEDAKALNEEVLAWQAESAGMKQILDNGNAAAHKMTMHDEADKVYAENVSRWEAVDKCIKDWIAKMESLVKMWTDQAGSIMIKQTIPSELFITVDCWSGRFVYKNIFPVTLFTSFTVVLNSKYFLICLLDVSLIL